MYARKITVYLIFANLHLIVKSDYSLFKTSGDSEQVAKTAECVLKLSAKYFVEKKALSGSIVIIAINSYASTTEKLLFLAIHAGRKYTVMVKDSFYPHFNASHFTEKAKNYMIILEERSELIRNVMLLSRLPTWNPLAKAVVFYKLEPNEEAETAAIEFINVLRDYKLLRTIIFLTPPDDDEVISYTWKPYSKTNCGGLCDSVYILDRCKNETVVQINEQHDVYPSNMNACPLVALAIVAEPYVLPPIRKPENATYKDEYIFDKGGDVNLVKIICQFTNMTLITRMSDVIENWGIILPNGSATGAYGILRNDLVDLVIGNIEVTRTIRQWFHPTVSYAQDDMTFCVPKAGQASTWNNLVIIFQWSTWVCTLVSLIAMGIIFHYFYYREHGYKVTKWPTNSFLMTFSMLLGWSSGFEPKSATFRILVFGWLCFSINMGISYVSFLRSFLMHPRFEKQISTEAELIQSGIPLGGREIYRSYFETNNASSFYLYRKYNSTSFAEGITRAALGRNFAVVSSRRQAAYVDQKLGRGQPLIYCFPERSNLYEYGVVLLARKWFPLLERFNTIIRSLSENGLIDKWNQELFIHSMNAEDSGTVVPLSIPHLLGAFMFIGLMYCASIVVFFIELSIVYYEKRKTKGSLLNSV